MNIKKRKAVLRGGGSDVMLSVVVTATLWSRWPDLSCLALPSWSPPNHHVCPVCLLPLLQQAPLRGALPGAAAVQGESPVAASWKLWENIWGLWGGIEGTHAGYNNILTTSWRLTAICIFLFPLNLPGDLLSFTASRPPVVSCWGLFGDFKVLYPFYPFS